MAEPWPAPRNPRDGYRPRDDPGQAADGFVKVTGITLKELEVKGSFLDKKSRSAPCS
ncbi:MAG UNVERIFIED_CONTAM: hypothetical protein LVR29_13725 [Microcystis novacekii LVE1205-3]